MRVDHVLMVYFSPNGRTEDVCKSIGFSVAKQLNVPAEAYAFTYPAEREAYPVFDEKTLTLFAAPVYAGRIPNVLLPYLSAMRGCGAAIPLAVFGNRSDDMALAEWKRLLIENGFFVPAAAAFVAQHSFSNTLAAGRPDAEDRGCMQRFAEELACRCAGWKTSMSVALPHDGEELRYYQPQTRTGEALRFLKARPEVSEACIRCGCCASVCPMGSIAADGSNNGGICIKCNACIKVCAAGARQITHPDYLATSWIWRKAVRSGKSRFLISLKQHTKTNKTVQIAADLHCSSIEV